MNFRQRYQLTRELNEGKDSFFNKWSGHELGENEPKAPTSHDTQKLTQNRSQT